MDCLSTKSLYHTFAAPDVIKEKFPKYASANILSAVFKHTTGDENMSIFDQIIFIADFAESGRTYETCKKIRKILDERMIRSKNCNDATEALNLTMIDTIDAVISTLERLGEKINQRTILTRNSFLSKI